MAMSTVVVSMLWAGLLRQQPSSTWKPNFEPLGMFCYKNSKNPNIPPSRQHDFPHSGGCGCENTQFRWIDGEMYDKTTGVPDLHSITDVHQHIYTPYIIRASCSLSAAQ